MKDDPASLHVPDVLKLLASDGRGSLLTLLARSDDTIQELTDRVGLPKNLISYHLHKLRTHGLVSERRSAADHRDIYYHLELERLQTDYFVATEQVHPAFHVTERPHSEAASLLPHPSLRLHEKGKSQ